MTIMNTMKKPTSIGDLSAIVTGLLLAYSLPPTTPLYMVAAGAVFGLVVTCCFVVAGQDDERSGIK